MKRAVLVTGHYWGSKRKAGFHWLADALLQDGWEVLFFTAGFSWLSILRRDYRLASVARAEVGRLVPMGDRLRSFVWWTPWHPANLRVPALNYFSRRLFRRYGGLPLGEAADSIASSRLFIFESMCGLLLTERFRELSAGGRFVYRVSDDLRCLRAHPVVQAYEQSVAPTFDLVSVPSRKLLSIFDGCSNVRLQLHGIRKDLFEKDDLNPYRNAPGPHAVFVGTSQFDCDFLKRASRLLPNFQFHIIGPIRHLPTRPNITAYGELPHQLTIPYIRYADIGLNNLLYSPGAEAFTDSLKVVQYTYCRLPIVAPAFLARSYGHIFNYTPQDDTSIRKALLDAQEFDRAQVSTEQINSWRDVVSGLLGENAPMSQTMAQ